MATADLFEFIVVGFIMIVVIGLFAYAFNLITDAVGQDVLVGQVNLSNATDLTIGKINDAILDKLNLIGMMILFGMILGMVVNAYFNRSKYPKLFFVLDIIILILAYIISTYVSNAYEIIITTDPFQSIFQTNLSSASTFLLRLPIYSVIIGIIIMIISYSDIPRSVRDELYMAGEQ